MAVPELKIVDPVTGEHKQTTSRRMEPKWSIDQESAPDLDIALETEDLYPASSDFTPELVVAFRLLDEGIERVNEALLFFKDNDFISSDDSVQRLRALLPELFCCRSLGDGFGGILNALHHGISNLAGKPLNELQIQAVRNSLIRLKNEPFIAFEESVELVMLLEESGLCVEPIEYKYIADMLIDE